jgi:hypothetical protein
MARLNLCRWNCGRCGRKTDRICGSCFECCNERKERNKRIDAGLELYVPPTERPGHRFYRGAGKRERTDKQKAALASLNRLRVADSAKRMPRGGGKTVPA